MSRSDRGDSETVFRDFLEGLDRAVRGDHQGRFKEAATPFVFGLLVYVPRLRGFSQP